MKRTLYAAIATAALFVDLSSASGCWKRAFGRGVGKPVHHCSNNKQKDGALCYDYCKTGYHGVGPVCWSSCPSGYKDTGIDCMKPKPYGRGAGYAIWDKKKCKKHHPQGC